MLAQKLTKENVRVSVRRLNGDNVDVVRVAHQTTVPVGVLVDGHCDQTQTLMNQASFNKLFDAVHSWLILTDFEDDNCTEYVMQTFQWLNLSVNADVAVVANRGDSFAIIDVYNFGKIQGNHLETALLGTWQPDQGLEIILKGYKYYNRWDFHNLTLRAISVIVDQPKVFYPEMLSEMTYTSGVAAMTKITTQMLNTIKERHNFRFNYSIASRWIGSPERNSTMAVTNTLFWEEQDLSSTCARIFPKWLNWVDIYHPPTTNLQTKFYYSLIPETGCRGQYEGTGFLTLGCSHGGLGGCVLLSPGIPRTRGSWQPRLRMEKQTQARDCMPSFRVFAAGLSTRLGRRRSGCWSQTLSSQGRRTNPASDRTDEHAAVQLTTPAVWCPGCWTLRAPFPSANLEGLINSDFELVLEDIGYTRGWLDNPGFFYYSGFKNVKEDELRDKKVTKAKRTVSVLQNVNKGVELLRTGKYAFHTEPYTASQVISKTYEDKELCNLGALQMMLPAHVYIMAQKKSPYKEFFDWSLLRLLERGHVKAIRARFAGTMSACSGAQPRALALGQAAPAFLMLASFAVLSCFILVLEVLWKRVQLKNRGQ
uniref:Putative chemosensory ionotropic receptor IR1 n=1 Tax=Spodoptera littoralis TaxID=7109 RepID=E5FIB3_SPOLI|nr:putative chemosensory ionotropic receptor IR1 [Spodoptera littoralis]